MRGTSEKKQNNESERGANRETNPRNEEQHGTEATDRAKKKTTNKRSKANTRQSAQSSEPKWRQSVSSHRKAANELWPTLVLAHAYREVPRSLSS